MYRVATTCGDQWGGLAVADAPYRIATTIASEQLQVKVIRPVAIRPFNTSLPLLPDIAEGTQDAFELDLGGVAD